MENDRPEIKIVRGLLLVLHQEHIACLLQQTRRHLEVLDVLSLAALAPGQAAKPPGVERDAAF